MMYGFNLNKTANISDFINEGEKIKFGNSELDIIYTPGHAAGSICIISHNDEFVITGDVLFHESIGRTDLPTGDFDLLKNNILNKLFTLPDVYTVYPGHGPETSIGHEKGNNPFL
jgi:glyoxylase-like metal-dependent hydrolase (beta-lactamase superfamily II)